MTIHKNTKRIWNIVSTIIVAIVVIFAVLLVGVRLFGLHPYTVLSGSMEPTYQTGSLIYVKKVKPHQVKVGDPITFVLNEELTVATHRVVKIDEENQHFYTKGDANEAADSVPVHYNNLIGVPQFSIPYLGYAANFVQNPPGLYITIAAGAVLLLLIFLPDLLSGGKKKNKNAAVQTETSESEQDLPDSYNAKR